MTEAEWIRFLGVNTAVLVLIFGLSGLWLWLLRRSAWARRIRTAVLVAAVIAALYGVVAWIGQSAPPAGTPAYVWPWGLLVFTAVGVATISILVLLISSILLGYRRLRSPR